MQGKVKNAKNSSLIVTKGLLDNAIQNVLSQVVGSQNEQDQRFSAELSNVVTDILAQRKLLIKKGVFTEDEFVDSIREVLAEVKSKFEVKKTEENSNELQQTTEVPIVKTTEA